MRTTMFAGCLVVAAGCGDAGGMAEGGATSGGTSTGDSLGGSVTGGPTGGEQTGGQTGGPTSSDPTGGGSTASVTDGGASTTGSSSGSSGGGESSTVGGDDSSTGGGGESSTGGGDDSSTGGPAGGCASACDRTSVHEGDLVIGPGDATDGFKCVTRVTGNVSITGDIDPAALTGLADLQEVDGELSISGNGLLTDLSPFACLRTVGASLKVRFMLGLTDLSGLDSLESAWRFNLRATGVASLAGLPAGVVVHHLDFYDNPELSELSALAGWEVSEGGLGIRVGANPKVFDMLGFSELLGQAGPGVDVTVDIFDSVGMTSLAGLEAFTHGDLSLDDLPLIEDLEPLANYGQAGLVQLNELPLVSTLHGLHNLKTVSKQLILGDCLGGGQGGGGMDGLTDLSGLDGLTAVKGLGIANSLGLVGLGGAPKLKGVTYLELVDDPKLEQGAVDAFVAQLAEAPVASCFGDWGECTCFDIEPP